MLWALHAGIIIALLGVVSDKIAQIIDIVWMGFAEVLGRIFPVIALTAVFYLILFPLSILAKAFRRKDILLLKNSDSSHWVNKKSIFNKQSFKNMW